MPGGLESRSRDADGSAEGAQPEVSICRSCPGKFVFIESGNTDGWIATDAAVELAP